MGGAPVLVLVASLVHAVARGDAWHPFGLSVVLVALLIGALNFYLSGLRRLLHHWTRRAEPYRHVSGFPLIGTLVVVLGGVIGFGSILCAALGLLAVALDTGGSVWFLIATWRDLSVWDRAERTHTLFTMRDVSSARAMAVHVHGDQKYGDKPYVAHLDDVAELCRAHGETVQIIAYLHDALEDTTLTAEEIETAYGTQVRACVEAVTDAPGPNRKAKKVATYSRLGSIAARSDQALALIVKAADRLANVRACVRDGNDRLLGMYREEQAAFETAVRRRGLNDPLMDEIGRLLAPSRP